MLKYSIFKYFEVVFHWMLSSIQQISIKFSPIGLSLNLRKIRSVIAEIFNFNLYEIIFHFMSSSCQWLLILVWSPSFSLNFDEDLISGSWGFNSNNCEVFFISRNFDLGWIPKFKFKIWSVVAEILNFNHFVFIFHLMPSSFQENSILVWSNYLSLKC